METSMGESSRNLPEACYMAAASEGKVSPYSLSPFSKVLKMTEHFSTKILLFCFVFN